MRGVGGGEEAREYRTEGGCGKIGGGGSPSLEDVSEGEMGKKGR